MMPRRKKRSIIMVCIILLILMIAGIFIWLYMNTDMFKSNATLFTKYMGQNVWNLSSFCDKIGTDEYYDLIKQNEYTIQTQVKVNYIENLGTSSENRQNPINQLNLKMDGQTDANNQYNYQNIKLLSNDQEVLKAEYVQKGNTYGIKFSDISDQYIVANNQRLKELFKKLDYTEEQLTNIPDEIEFDYDLRSIFQLSEEEKQSMKTKYLNMIKANVSKDNFTKQANQIIQVDGKNIKANAYCLKITKEQINNIYIKALEEIKQDEIILSRLDKIQEILKKYQMNEEISLREQFKKKVEDLISDITKNNIGQDEVTITVYENNQTTVSSMIQTPDYEMYIHLLSYETEDYMQLSYKNKENANQQENVFTYKNEGEKTNITLDSIKDGKKTEYSLAVDEKIEDNNCKKDTIIKYENDENRVEVSIAQEAKRENALDKEITLKDENSINLSKVDKEQAKATIDKVNTGISEKVNQITATVIKPENLWEVLKATGLVKEEQVLEAMGVSETERNRFNSQFEILQGDNLESAKILKMIEAIKGNLIDMEVVSNTELKLKLDRSNNNQELATILSTFIGQSKNKNKKYNVKVEYDKTTGLVNNIILTMLK